MLISLPFVYPKRDLFKCFEKMPASLYVYKGILQTHYRGRHDRHARAAEIEYVGASNLFGEIFPVWLSYSDNLARVKCSLEYKIQHASMVNVLILKYYVPSRTRITEIPILIIRLVPSLVLRESLR